MDLEKLVIDFSWKEKDINLFLPIVIALTGFIFYWFSAQSKKIKAYFIDKYEVDQASINHILFTKYMGLFFMGIFPCVVCLILLPEYSLADYGIYIEPKTCITSLLWILILSIVIIPLVSYSARQPKNLENYPQIRAKEWNLKLKFKNALGWAFYLLGYEILFRAILLFPLYYELGLWPAIAINTAIYSATHIPKGIDETLGAIPLGIVLCILTLITNTIWVAFIIHVIMAWTNSFTALKHHPNMKSI
jgi:membrane protease YdiL (CAAX protease family)